MLSMAFQFLCPQGHLLQGEASQTGQKCKCPYCQSEFLVPAPAQAPEGDPGAGSSGPAVDEAPVFGRTTPSPDGDNPPGVFPGIRVGPAGGATPIDSAPQFGGASAEGQSLLHIPCPNGHILETPREMLGQDAMCPFCQAQFRLRFEDSQERRREKSDQRARREQKLGTAWMNWAIAAAVVVVLGIVVLIAIAASS